MEHLEMSYNDMLERVYSQLPPEVFEHKRLELPKPRSYIAGPRTIIHNFKEICEIINREPRDVLKFLSKEMATAGSMDGSRAIFQGRFTNDMIVRLIDKYFKDLVVCPICKRPDTRILKEKRLFFLKCEACGARSSIRSY
jgi:translation initiation factor 2 subunit 2